MRYAWSSELETGYKSIDEQHKQLVVALNDLLDACQRGKHRYELDKTLDFLLVYTTTHFADEEEFQLQHKYPDYAQHKLLHDNFKVAVTELAARLMREGATISLIAEVHSTIGEWLVEHIKGEDLKIALHAREHS